MKLFSIVLVMSVFSAPLTSLAENNTGSPQAFPAVAGSKGAHKGCPFATKKDPAPCDVVSTSPATKRKTNTGSVASAAPKQG